MFIIIHLVGKHFFDVNIDMREKNSQIGSLIGTCPAHVLGCHTLLISHNSHIVCKMTQNKNRGRGHGSSRLSIFHWIASKRLSKANISGTMLMSSEVVFAEQYCIA